MGAPRSPLGLPENISMNTCGLEDFGCSLVHSQTPISAQVIPVLQSPRDLISEPCGPQPEPGHGRVPSGTGQRLNLFLFVPRLAVSLGT